MASALPFWAASSMSKKAPSEVLASASMVRMGFAGAAHKELRHTLTAHLNGYAAFKSEAGMRAHREKYARLRREQQAAKEGSET